jgi:hypothetical protein
MCLLELDVQGIRQLWHLIAQNMPQPKSDAEALKTIHYARTLMESIPLRKRFYSHRWLIDHGILSGLPDTLRPTAERTFPRMARSVGLSINTHSEMVKPAVPLIRGAIESAINEAYADGKHNDIPHIKERMKEAKTTTVRKLFGM